MVSIHLGRCKYVFQRFEFYVFNYTKEAIDFTWNLYRVQLVAVWTTFMQGIGLEVKHM